MKKQHSNNPDYLAGYDPLGLTRVLSRAETRKEVGLSDRTWDRLEAAGDTPPITMLSPNRVGYRLIDVAKWLDARRVSHADDQPRREALASRFNRTA
jgi:predicted DNA-binding transcriptional regulator AlpA